MELWLCDGYGRNILLAALLFFALSSFSSFLWGPGSRFFLHREEERHRKAEEEEEEG